MTDVRTEPRAERVMGRRADLIAAAVGVALVALAVVVGQILHAQGLAPRDPAAPLRGSGWKPRAGVGTPLALLVAVLVVGYGPHLAERLRWRVLLLVTWAASLGWILSLGLVDGWHRLAKVLGRGSEYLSALPDMPPWSQFLATYADKINGPDRWGPTHVAGHPPGALGFFGLLDEIGLRDSSWGAAVVILLGSTGAVAVAVTLRALGDEHAARRAVPFLVVVPGALWMAVSADAMFLAVAAWGIALLALSSGGSRKFDASRQTPAENAGAYLRRRSLASLGGVLRGVATSTVGGRRVVTAVAAGLLLGVCLYLSYGLVLLGAIALAVLIVTRDIRAGVIAGLAVVAVVAAVTLGGFAWWEGLTEVRERYASGWAGDRLYSYWVWANLANVVIAAGLAVVPGWWRAVVSPTSAVVARTRLASAGTIAVVGGATVACLVATLSGLSKAETERIWLPFVIWLVPAATLLPPRDHRWWLGLSAGVALVIQHFVGTSW